MPYRDPVKWELDHTIHKERSFNDHTHTPVASFHPDVFTRAYALRPPRQLLNSKFLDEAMSRFSLEEVVKSSMENPPEYVPKPTNSYHVSWFKEPFSFFVAMFYQLYGFPNCSMFKVEWVHVSHHILLTGESFNWACILSINLKEEIEKYHKT